MTNPERGIRENERLLSENLSANVAAIERLRQEFDHALIEQVEVSTREEAIERATKVVDFILKKLKQVLGMRHLIRWTPATAAVIWRAIISQHCGLQKPWTLIRANCLLV